MTMLVNARKDGRVETAMRVSIVLVFPLHIHANVWHSSIVSAMQLATGMISCGLGIFFYQVSTIV